MQRIATTGVDLQLYTHTVTMT